MARNLIDGQKAGSGSPRQPVIAPDSASSITKLKMAVGLSEGEIEGFGRADIKLDGTPLSELSSDIICDYRFGTNNQEYINGVDEVANEIGVGVELSRDWVKLITNSDIDHIGIRLRWPPLQTSHTNGDVSGVSITYEIHIAAVGGQYERVLATTLSDKTSDSYERYHEFKLPESDNGWMVKVVRVTPSSQSSTISDKMYVQAYSEIIKSKFTFPHTSLVYLEYNAKTFSNVAKLAVNAKGLIIKVPSNYDPVTRQYSGLWTGTFKMAYSNNPAWVYYDLVTNSRYGCGDRIDSSMVDKWSLYRLAQYCDQMVDDGYGGLEPRFTCNVYLQSKERAYDILNRLTGLFRAINFWNGSQLVVDADIPQDTSYLYTNANVVDGLFEYAGTAATDQYSAAKVAWDNPANGYNTEYEAVSYEHLIKKLGFKVLELDAWGCTSRGQALRAGRWALLAESDTVTFKVGMDGYLAMPGKIIEIQDEFYAGKSNGGRVISVSASRLEVTLDRPVETIAGDTISFNTTAGKVKKYNIVSSAGSVVTLSEEVDASVERMHIWAISSSQLATQKYRILTVKYDGVGEFTISAVEYNASKYEEIDSNILFDEPPTSILNPIAQDAVKNVVIDSHEFVYQGLNTVNLNIKWERAVNAVEYLVEIKKDNGSWLKLPATGNNSIELENIFAGSYIARVTAVSAFELKSLPTYSVKTVVQGKLTAPLSPLNPRLVPVLFGIEFYWDFPANSADIAVSRIAISYEDPTHLTDESSFITYDKAYSDNKLVLQHLDINTRVWFKVKLIDKLGFESPYTAWVNGQPSQDVDKVLDLISGHISEGTLDQTLKGKIDGAGALAGEAQDLANQAKAAAANAQTTANNAGTAAANAQTAATAAANAAAKEVTDRVAAIAAEAKARTDGLTKEATDRAAAITKEATDRAAALTAQATTLKADSAAKVKALKDEVDPKITTLQNGITQVTTDYKAGDTAVVGQLNAYKTSNDSAVASVLQKAESAVSTGSTNSSAITAINGQIASINNTKLDASVISGYYTKGQTDAKAAEIAAGKVEEFNANLRIGGDNLFSLSGIKRYYGGSIADTSLFTVNGREIKCSNKGSSDRIGNAITLVDTTQPLLMRFTDVDGVNDNVLYYRCLASDGTTIQAQRTVTGTRVGKVVNIAVPATSIPEGTATINIGFGGSSAAITVTDVMVVNANVMPEWTSSSRDVQAALDTNSTAIQNTNAEVTRVDGVATAANNATTALSGRVSAVEGSVATKAEAAALTALTTRVSNAEGVNTSQGTAITSLENSVNHATTGLASKASSSALTAVDNKVTAANGRIDTTNSNVSTLSGRVDTVEGAVSTKAEAAALTALTTRVGNAEGVNTSQGTAITTLQNTVNHATTGLATKASTSALTATNSEVSRVNGVVTGHAGQLTQLAADITTINGNLATKADASALNDIYTKTQTDAKATEIAAGEISKYDASLVIGGSNLYTGTNPITLSSYAGSYAPNAIQDTATISSYFDASTLDISALKHGDPVCVSMEFMIPSTSVGDFEWILSAYRLTNGSATSGIGYRESTKLKSQDFVKDKWYRIDLPQGYYPTTATSERSSLLRIILYNMPVGAQIEWRNLMIEKATKHSPYVSSDKTVQSKIDANSTAIENTNAEVIRVDGRVTTESTRITTLTGRVSTVEGDLAKKADASALSSLTTRVESEEGKSTSQGSAITALQNTVNHATTGLATKASSSALTAVDNKVTAANGRIDTTNSNVTTLSGRVATVEGDISKKADASALNSLTTRVATEEGKSTSQGSAITALENSVNHATTGLSTKASSAALTTVDNKVIAVDGRVTATNSNVAALTGRVSTVEGNLTTKADVSAVNALTTRVGEVEGGLATQATNTTSLTASLEATDKIAKDALPKVGGSGSFKTFKEVLNYYLASSNSANNIVIQTSITMANNMFRLSGKGYNYTGKKSVIDFEVSGYARSSQTFLQHGAANNGTFAMRIRIGVKDSMLCVILSPNGTNFSYPAFTIDAAVSYGSVPESFKDGWSASSMTEDELASNGITGIIEPSLLDVGNELSANAAAINTTNAEVSRIDGVVKGHVTDIRNLTTSIAGKADASAVNALTVRVDAEEGKSASQGTAITNLENAVNNSTTGLASKASAQALTTLNNQVQHSTTGLSAVNTKVDNLKATVENTTNGLASKASSSALDTLSNKVNHSTTGLDAIASKTTVLESNVAQALDVVTISDVRDTDELPQWYWTKYARNRVNEFKRQTAIGVSGFFGGTYCNLETIVYFPSSSGGGIIQTATSSADPSLYVQRRSSGSGTAAVWTPWAQPIKDLRDSLAGKAAASAVESLTTRVGTAEGRIDTEAGKLTTLSTTVGGHTTTINSQTTSINGIRGVHALKFETNGVISGYGLISELVNGTVKSQFGINADNFFIGAPSSNKKPFVVYTTPGVINGVTVPAGTYIDTAFIGDATIGTAHINDLAVTTAKIGDGQIITAKIGDLQVDTIKIKDNAVTSLLEAQRTQQRVEQNFSTIPANTLTSIKIKVVLMSGLSKNNRYLVYWRGVIGAGMNSRLSNTPQYLGWARKRVYFGSTSSTNIVGSRILVETNQLNGNYFKWYENNAASTGDVTQWNVAEGIVDETGSLCLWVDVEWKSFADTIPANTFYGYLYTSDLSVLISEFKK